MQQPQHQAIKPLSWMIGTWFAKKASGQYPTIKNFEYNEKLEVTHPAPNQPCLHLKFSAWFQNEKLEKQFAHFEYGILKANPNCFPLFLVYTSSHNNGLAIVEEGIFEEKSKLIHLKSVNVGRTSMNNPPAVIEIQREIKLLDQGNLAIKTFMATSSHEKLEEHLFVEYTKGE